MFDDAIKAVELNDSNNTLSVVRIVDTGAINAVYTPGFQQPTNKRIFKDIYGVVDGQIKLIKTIEGSVQPSQFIPESFSFPK